MKRKIKIAVIVIVVVILAGLGLKYCIGKRVKDISSSQPQQSYTVKRGDIISKIEITGEIQPQTTVQIKSKVSGKVVKFYVDENDYVKSGQIIADIEPDYNQANALFSIKTRLATAEIRLKNAEKGLSDKRQMSLEGFISQNELSAAEDELTTAQLEYRQALQQYELVRELDTEGKVTHVYATASGTVIQRPVQEGEMIISSTTSFGEGSVILKVADLKKMVVRANIHEVDIAKFKEGQKASVRVDALPYEEFEGTIAKIAPMASIINNAVVFPVEISLTNPSPKLKPGMTGNVSITGESRINVLVIPIQAVFIDDKNQDIVYLLKAGTQEQLDKTAKPADKRAATMATEQAVATPVKLGGNDLRNVEVIEGLKEGDRISLTEPASAVEIDAHFSEF